MATLSTVWRGHLAAAFTIVVWGTTYIATKVLLESFTPMEILFIRFLIGYIVLLLLCPQRIRNSSWKQEMTFAGAGACGITLYFLFENIALVYTYASNVGIIISVAPFFTALLAGWFLQGEGMTYSFFAGFLAAMGGIALISLNGAALALNPFGDLLALIAAVIWAMYSVLMRRIAAFSYSSMAVTRHVFFYGLVLMLPFLGVFGFQPDAGRLLQPVYLANMLFLGVGASAICFVTWNFSVKVLGAIKTSIYIYAAPVVTVICSMIILEEKITVLAVAGIALISLGLLISQGLLGVLWRTVRAFCR